jgi:hypothetical protein
MDLLEIGWGSVDWIGLTQVESSCEFGTEPSASMKCWESIEWPNKWVLSPTDLVIIVVLCHSDAQREKAVECVPRGFGSLRRALAFRVQAPRLAAARLTSPAFSARALLPWPAMADEASRDASYVTFIVSISISISVSILLT